MATATKSKPVAGQPGYKPEVEYPNLGDLQKEGEERALTPVQPKPKRESSAQPLPAKEATGAELLDYLVSSGTNPTKMAHAREWLAEKPGATALETFRYLENAEDHGQPATSSGTLRKAGKWLYGSAWELESAVLQAPAEEIKNLREKVGTLEGQLASKNNEVASLRTQIAFLQEANGKLGSQVDFLKNGKSPEELRSIGIG